MRINIITGLSGAGKTQVLKILEDFGFLCVDNLPAHFIDEFFEWAKKYRKKNPIALGIDIRAGVGVINAIEREGKQLRVVYLEADTSTLINRYKQSRRKHPLGGTLSEAIARERKLTSKIKQRAEHVIDTSNLTLQELKQILYRDFEIEGHGRFEVNIISFGYKFGLPAECDMVFDVRFIRNPNYIKKLKYLTGLNNKVRKYVFSDKSAVGFLRILKEMLSFLLPKYIAEGKSYLTVGFGCTGGHHRSVAAAEEFAKYIRLMKYDTRITHRDIDKKLTN